MINNNVVGKAIATLRQSRGMTQQQLAAALNVSHQAVSRWENGCALPDLQTMMSLTGLFGITVEQLIHGDIPLETPSEEKPLTLDDHLQNIGSFIGSIVDDIFHPEKENDPVAGDPQNECSEDGEDSDVPEDDGFDIANVLRMAPFMSKSALDEILLAHKDRLSTADIEAVAPFVSRDCLEKLIRSTKEGMTWQTLQTLAPFLRKEVVDRLTKAAIAGRNAFREASKPGAKAEDEIDQKIVSFSQKAGKSVEDAIRTTARIGREAGDVISGAMNGITETMAARNRRAEELRIAAFERALTDDRWDWIAAHIDELNDEAVRKRIAQTANAKGMHDWVLAHMEDYADTRTIDAAIESGNWGWLGDHVWQFEDDLQEHIAMAAAKAENWQWLSDFAAQISLENCVDKIAIAAYTAGARVLAMQLAQHCMTEEQAARLADAALARADFEFVEQIRDELEDSWFDALCLTQAQLHDWERVRQFAEQMSDDGLETVMRIAIEQGDFDAIDMLSEYL